MKPARRLILLGSIVLFASGLLHLLGYPNIFPPLVKAGVEAKLIGAIKALWSAFSVQFVILALPSSGSAAGRKLATSSSFSASFR